MRGARTRCSTARIECRLLRFDVTPEDYRWCATRAAPDERGDSCATRRANVRESLAQESQGGAGLGEARRRSIAIASTMPTCPSTRSRSISTAMARAALGRRAGICAAEDRRCRRRRGSVATKRLRSSRTCWGCPRNEFHARASPAEGGLRSTRRWSTSASSTSCASGRIDSPSTSATIWIRVCSSITD